jgi:hypothetical protein
MPKLSIGLGITTVGTKPVPATTLSYLGSLLKYIGQLLTFTP